MALDQAHPPPHHQAGHFRGYRVFNRATLNPLVNGRMERFRGGAPPLISTLFLPRSFATFWPPTTHHPPTTHSPLSPLAPPPSLGSPPTHPLTHHPTPFFTCPTELYRVFTGFFFGFFFMVRREERGEINEGQHLVEHRSSGVHRPISGVGKGCRLKGQGGGEGLS